MLTENVYIARQMTTVTLPQTVLVTTWIRYGIAQDAKGESVESIIARWKAEILDMNLTAPAGRSIKEHMMDLEVQAVMAKAQNPTSVTSVRDTIKSYMDIFLNDWLAANPKTR